MIKGITALSLVPSILIIVSSFTNVVPTAKLVLVTHEMNLAERCDRTMVLQAGCQIKDSSNTDLVSS